MILTIDIGNTQTVLGLFDKDALVRVWRIATQPQHTSDELCVSYLSLMEAHSYSPASVESACIASVVPNMGNVWKQALNSLHNTPVCFARDVVGTDLFTTNYPNPLEIGSDRIADALAAWDLCKQACIVLDFGTATNIEVIDSNGLFVGGIIAPGIQASAAALFSKAARLSAIELTAPLKSIGRSTEEAVQSGIIYGEVCRADGLVARIEEELGCACFVVGTGGLVDMIAPLSTKIMHVDKNLTLKGLLLIHNYLKSRHDL